MDEQDEKLHQRLTFVRQYPTGSLEWRRSWSSVQSCIPDAIIKCEGQVDEPLSGSSELAL
jgi:hypothetical protein